MGNFSEKSRKTYDAMADGYDQSREGRYTAGFKDLLLANMEWKAGDAVLDVACGSGLLLARMERQRPIRGFGVDISGGMIKNAVARYPQFTFAVAACENIPFGDGAMDVITVCAAYHHFPNVDAFAREAKRLLKPGGSLYIAEIYLPGPLRVIVNPFVPLSKEGDVRFYSGAGIAKTFAKAGFGLVQVIRDEHIQLVHLKRGP